MSRGTDREGDQRSTAASLHVRDAPASLPRSVVRRIGSKTSTSAKGRSERADAELTWTSGWRSPVCWLGAGRCTQTSVNTRQRTSASAAAAAAAAAATSLADWNYAPERCDRQTQASLAIAPTAQSTGQDARRLRTVIYANVAHAAKL